MCLQTDDKLTVANESFIRMEKSAGKRFQSSPLKDLPENEQTLFNGMCIFIPYSLTYLGAEYHCRTLLPLNISKVNAANYIAQRARGEYISSLYRLFSF